MTVSLRSAGSPALFSGSRPPWICLSSARCISAPGSCGKAGSLRSFCSACRPSPEWRPMGSENDPLLTATSNALRCLCSGGHLFLYSNLRGPVSSQSVQSQAEEGVEQRHNDEAEHPEAAFIEPVKIFPAFEDNDIPQIDGSVQQHRDDAE